MRGYLLSLAAASLLFAPPVVVLATLTPYAVRLAGWGRADLGRVAGELSAFGALGSIAGTFLTSLVLLPVLGSRNTLLVAGAVLASVGVGRAFGARGAVTTAALFVALGAAYQGAIRSDEGLLEETESLYSYVQVRRDVVGRVRLLTNESLAYQSVWPSDGLLTGGVWDYLALAPALAEPSGSELHVLVVGLAGGTVARQIHEAYSPASRVVIRGIELDPEVVDAGRRYFGLGSIPDLTIELGDGRVNVEALDGRFDAIIIDVFRGLYVPPHLVTREFFEACRLHLEPGGVLAMNVANPRGSPILLGALVATLETVFSQVRFTSLPSEGPIENVVLFASGTPLHSLAAERVPPALATLGLGLRSFDVPERNRRVLTDDHAPIEWLTDLALLEALR